MLGDVHWTLLVHAAYLFADGRDRPAHRGPPHRPSAPALSRRCGVRSAVVPTFQNAHVLVTGGSSGIGLATARLAVDRGARVSLIARRADVLDEAAASLRAAGRAGRGRGRPTWPTPAQVDVAVSALTDALGPVDIAICSAGQARPGYFQELDPELFRTMMDVNYFGTVNVVRAVVPSMIERRGGQLRRRVVGRRARRRVRLHRVRADEVRGARISRVVPRRAAAVRDSRRLLVPARHRHAAARRREPLQAEGDARRSRARSSRCRPSGSRRASSRASRRNGSRSFPTSSTAGSAKITGLAPGRRREGDGPLRSKKAQSAAD